MADEQNAIVLVPGVKIVLSDDLLSGANAAAGFVGVKPRTIYAMAEAGHLPVIRMGRRLFFRKSELEAAFRAVA